MASYLSRIEAPKGANKAKKRLGRGEASGLGKTSGRGHKGQKARAGGFHKRAFEGGQMTLIRRMPKSGFTNIFRKTFAVINLNQIAKISGVTIIDPDFLLKNKMIRKLQDGLKILGEGELTQALTIKAHKFSASALAKIQKAGGQAEIIK